MTTHPVYWHDLYSHQASIVSAQAVTRFSTTKTKPRSTGIVTQVHMDSYPSVNQPLFLIHPEGALWYHQHVKPSCNILIRYTLRRCIVLFCLHCGMQ